ncbi:HAD domain-containing protein [Paraburkholderia sp. EG287A]|uniref:HAD domain-containing protein n=1 Tax=Paraburkholderia sp. EG287A TaxID=3237012 RepID=UPI0034D302ED
MLHPIFARWLFVDFDGVLHPGLAGTLCYRDRLEAFLLEHTDIGVVLSTSWRLHYTHDELRRLFSSSIRERIVGVTPALPDSTRAQRYSEIQVWLRRHGGGRRWAALDDDETLFPAFCDELVLCDSARGLRPAHLQKVAGLLGLPAAGVMAP